MPKRLKINDELTVGTQPDEEALATLKQDGFHSVVNIRKADEDSQPLPPEPEGKRVTDLGMEYLHMPISVPSLTSAQVDEFRRKVKDLRKPVFMHCKLGSRAGAMAIMDWGVAHGMTGEQTVEKGRGLGLTLDNETLVQFVRDYVDTHREIAERSYGHPGGAAG